MRRILKTLLLWLLLAALPIQGIAAAAMMSCRSVQSMATTVSPAAEHSHHGKAMHGHHHQAQDTQAADHDGTGHQAGKHHSKGKHDASTSCSACAACCIGAAPVPANLDWTFVHNSSEPVVVSPTPFMTGFIPAGLERPPRIVFA